MDSAELLNNVVNGKPEPPLPYESASAAMDELRTALAEETEVIAFMAFLGSNNMDRPPKMHPILSAVLTDAWSQVETYKDNHGAEDVNIKTILELISTAMFASIHSKWIIIANLVGAVINQVNAIPQIAKDLFQNPNARIAFLRVRPYYLMHIITDINDSLVSIKGPTGENLNSESLKFLVSGNPKSVV